jgi:hypothetical protein
MRRNKHGTTIWIWFWGILTLMLAGLTQATQNTWIFWVTLVTVCVLIATTLWNVGRYFCRQKELRELATIDFGAPRSSTPNHVSYVSDSSQSVDITITMKADISVERIRLCFKGGTDAPKIEHLYDWKYPNYEPSNRELKEDLEHAWFWDYYQPLHRSKGSHIMIGIRYLASHSFNGILEIGLTCVGSQKIYALPFLIKGGELGKVPPTTS